MKIRTGIIFGGFSKEREISFAGGRTVYDNLNKAIFEPVPLFVDSFGNFVLLNWEFVYKGSIRDFYPPSEFLTSPGNYQVYAESLGNLSKQEQEALINKIGKKIGPDQLGDHIDFAFLCLHGAFGEDGKIQGLLEYLRIPYSGSGILPSAIGINKAAQKQLMVNAGFNSPEFIIIKKRDWEKADHEVIFNTIKRKFSFPVVVKSANQGSSIGVSILEDCNLADFINAINKSFFSYDISGNKWQVLSKEEKENFVRNLCDIREGIGIPVRIKDEIFYHPYELERYFESHLKSNTSLKVESLDGESEVIIEGFIEGKEFSCIVVENENGKPIALPPTEIRKGKELFDYRSKYLPGLSRKITPIDLPEDKIEHIRKECERLFSAFYFDVYARIDGFIRNDGTVFLNDPNTTSGMMPSSFFFHQAAEIGLNPSQFLTFIIRTSINSRLTSAKGDRKYGALLNILDSAIKEDKQAGAERIRIAVLLGGYSSERHISVESGRNIYEKLAASTKYEPFPVFLTGSADNHEMYHIPVNILLKDNADDIKEKILNYKIHPVVITIINECRSITEKYSGANNLVKPRKLSYEELAEQADVVFIALHGRPGEDGAVQQNLERVGLPYNGSGVESSQTTIDKFKTNEILKNNGFLVANHLLVTEKEWFSDKSKVLNALEKDIKFPFIAKPVDDGCSSAVRKIKSVGEFEAFARLIFRNSEELDPKAAEALHIKAKEEFPMKNVILVEELISKKDAKHFLEITGGMLTLYDKNGNLEYEVFEASEALSEGEVLSLEEKFLAGQGQNITPARYSMDVKERQQISDKVKDVLRGAASLLNVQGYSRIDAFVRIYDVNRVEVIFIEVNSLPGMTPATCIFHQSAINGYKPYEFIDKILDFAFQRKYKQKEITVNS